MMIIDNSSWQEKVATGHDRPIDRAFFGDDKKKTFGRVQWAVDVDVDDR